MFAWGTDHFDVGGMWCELMIYWPNVLAFPDYVWMVLSYEDIVENGHEKGLDPYNWSMQWSSYQHLYTHIKPRLYSHFPFNTNTHRLVKCKWNLLTTFSLEVIYITMGLSWIRYTLEVVARYRISQLGLQYCAIILSSQPNLPLHHKTFHSSKSLQIHTKSTTEIQNKKCLWRTN